MKPSTPKLLDLVDEARDGTLVIPEFQRSFIWDRRGVEDFLVSIFNDYFVGAILLLDVLPESAPFQPRRVEGVPDSVPLHPRKLVLDGQQRVTSMHYALYSPNVPLKGTSYPYRFFLSIPHALDGQWEDAVYSESRQYKWTENVAANQEEQFKRETLPISVLRSWESWIDWKEAYGDWHRDRKSFDMEVVKRLDRIARRFLSFEIAAVELPQSTDEETIVEVFERINRTGEPLSIFELLTARLYKHVRLRDLLDRAREEYPLFGSLAGEKDEQYPGFVLQVISLLRGFVPQRKNLILLKGDRFEEDWWRAVKSIERALQRMMHDGSGAYGAIPAISLPYSTMVPPLAALLYEVDRAYPNQPSALEKIHRWYWGTIFQERYGGSTATLIQRDYNQVSDWLGNNAAPLPEGVIADPGRIEALNVTGIIRQGAIYRGILSLVALAGARDFYKGDSIGLHDLDDHHIFPQAVLKAEGVGQDERNNIVNRTLISSETNRKFIRDRHPSDYLAEMEELHGAEGARQVLRTHFIGDAAVDAMRRDDYLAFLEARAQTIRAEIGRRCLGEQIIPKASVLTPLPEAEEYLVRRERKDVEQASRDQGRNEHYQVFFQPLIDRLREEHGFTNARVAQPQNWYSFTAGVASGITYGAVFTREGLRTELYIDVGSREENKRIFDALQEDADAIQERFHAPLSWERLDHRRASRIAVYNGTTIDAPDAELTEARDWAIRELLRLKEVFGPRLQELA